ncbi:hypothetical protein [Gordonia phthalatica]|uniref:Uncharacterized protein n=1 Tax=Gordonia phthalatica TaxID=1136941 RepID=A0A0N9N768_9ACTN|nr:hypothetical protein [Gordonia phthalatica]ALG86462.1 hypothetical protein ACH46_20655 [Gordonia phthalatica]
MDGLNTRTFDLGLPEPPYSTEVLAEFHAGTLDPVTEEHVRRRLPEDPHAADVLAALDRVRADLHALRQSTPPMPDAVATRLDALIDGLTAE